MIILLFFRATTILIFKIRIIIKLECFFNILNIFVKINTFVCCFNNFVSHNLPSFILLVCVLFYHKQKAPQFFCGGLELLLLKVDLKKMIRNNALKVYNAKLIFKYAKHFKKTEGKRDSE